MDRTDRSSLEIAGLVELGASEQQQTNGGLSWCQVKVALGDGLMWGAAGALAGAAGGPAGAALGFLGGFAAGAGSDLAGMR